MEEERRLAYVGITRAQQKLFVSHAWSRQLFGTTNYNPPSRFLDEIPTALVEESGAVGGRSGYGRQSYRKRSTDDGAAPRPTVEPVVAPVPVVPAPAHRAPVPAPAGTARRSAASTPMTTSTGIVSESSTPRSLPAAGTSRRPPTRRSWAYEPATMSSIRRSVKASSSRFAGRATKQRPPSASARPAPSTCRWRGRR